MEESEQCPNLRQKYDFQNSGVAFTSRHSHRRVVYVSAGHVRPSNALGSTFHSFLRFGPRFHHFSDLRCIICGADPYCA